MNIQLKKNKTNQNGSLKNLDEIIKTLVGLIYFDQEVLGKFNL